MHSNCLLTVKKLVYIRLNTIDPEISSNGFGSISSVETTALGTRFCGCVGSDKSDGSGTLYTMCSQLTMRTASQL